MIDHPLFPPPDDGQEHEPVDVERIQISRFEKGMQSYAPQLFHPNELNSHQDIHDIFGGGSYEIFARTLKGRIQRRERFNLAGEPKPLDRSEDGPAPKASGPAHSSPAPAARSAFDLTAIVIALAPAVIGLIQSNAAASSSGTIEMLKLMQMQQSQQESARLAAMQAWQGQQAEQQRQFLEMMRSTTVSNKSGDMDSFTSGMELMEKVLGKSKDPPKSEAEVIVEGAGSILAMIAARDREEADRRFSQQPQRSIGGTDARPSSRPPPPMATNGINGQAHHAPSSPPVQGPAV